MLAELRTKSQVTVPKPIVERLGLTVGDLFEVTERDGGIFLLPVVVTPRTAPRPAAERRATLRTLCGSIDDPTMTEPPELSTESPRKAIQ